MSTKSMVEVQNLEAGYGDEVILRDVSFSVGAGEVFFIAGASGCGKSTLLKHIIGLHKPFKGSVLIDGEDIVAASMREFREILRNVGVAYQSGALFGSMTLLDNIRLPLEEHTDFPGEAIESIAMSKLRLVGLQPSAFMMPAALSGGMQKRAAIARAIALDPKVVFLDEPSAGLDPITSASLDALIRQLSELLEMTFVIVSHELSSIFAVADRVLVLSGDSRTVVALGTPAELRDTSDDPHVRAFFNRQTEEEASSDTDQADQSDAAARNSNRRGDS